MLKDKLVNLQQKLQLSIALDKLEKQKELELEAAYEAVSKDQQQDLESKQ